MKTFRTYKLQDITAFSEGTQFTMGRVKRVYEYISPATDKRALYTHTIAVLYDFKAQKYIAVDLVTDKRANDTINIIYPY